MNIYAHQGDQVISKLSKPIKGKLEEAAELVIAGSHTSAHTIRGKVMTRVDGDRRFVRVAEPTVITHADRHNTTPLEAGDYVIYAQRERGGNGDRAVED